MLPCCARYPSLTRGARCQASIIQRAIQKFQQAYMRRRQARMLMQRVGRGMLARNERYSRERQETLKDRCAIMLQVATAQPHPT